MARKEIEPSGKEAEAPGVREKPIKLSRTSEKQQGFEVIRFNLEHLRPETIRFVHLSDIHLGPATKLEHLEKCLQVCKKLAPEFICLTGDLIQYSHIGIRHLVSSKLGPKYLDWPKFRRGVRALSADLYDLLSTIDCPIYVVPGNHDHYEGLGTLKRLSSRNVKWLIHKSISPAPGVRLYGIDDTKMGQKPSQDFLNTFPGEETFNILLGHNPDFVKVLPRDFINSFHLALSGHTHGGQIKLPYLPPPLTRTKQRKHISGLSYEGDTAIYVSKGVGYGSIPIRLFCPPDITVFEV